jgi:hypothetical protein
MQRYTIFFIAVNALHVSGGFSVHHQELQLYIQHLVYVKHYCQLTHASGSSKLDIHQMLYVQFEFLMMDGNPA